MEKSTLNAYNPATGDMLEGDFIGNTPKEVDEAVNEALDAFTVFRKTTGDERATLLETIAEEIEALGDELIKRASAETGLPEARITGERGRTVGQLRLFASIVKDGSWVEASIDTALPDRQPIPKPDLRKMLIPIGPVAIFTASNFPLAFSTAGGDTASALAGGNPVIVKGHEAHLGTHKLVSEAIHKAVKRCDLPAGVYTSLIGKGFEIGQTLVKHAGIRAVGFTGSRSGGRALFNLAVTREEPIPFYAEMSSINPIIMLPEATAQKTKEIAENIAGSITLGVGQFCTNPGLILGIEGSDLDNFCSHLSESIRSAVGGIMLTEGISKNYYKSSSEAISQEGVIVLSEGKTTQGKHPGKPIIARTSASNFMANPRLAQEIFGPYSLVISCRDDDQLAEVIMGLEGQLTATFMCTDSEIEEYEHLVALAEQKAGRVIFNNVPTGVEVCHSMVHGGPYPATTDAKFTSVGADAIKRFVRPVCYQNAKENMLPMELQNSNPLKIWRKIDGQFTDKAI